MANQVTMWNDIVGNKNLKEIITDSCNRGLLPSFVLFTGNSGIGKSTFAKMTAKTLLCKNKNEKGEPCGVCDECKALEEGTSVSYIKINVPTIFKKSEVTDKINEIFKLRKLSDKTVYVLEELHGLSKDLQTLLLEELTNIPEDVWILSCTTRPYDLLPEITNRAVQFKLQDPTQKECIKLVKMLSNRYKIIIEGDRAINTLVTQCNCNPRRINELIRMVATNNELTEDSLRKFFNIVPNELVAKYMDSIMIEPDIYNVITTLQELQETSNLYQINQTALSMMYDYVLSVSGGTQSEIPPDLRQVYNDCFNGISKQVIVACITVLGELGLKENESKSSQKSKIINGKQKIIRLTTVQKQSQTITNELTGRSEKRVVIPERLKPQAEEKPISTSVEIDMILAQQSQGRGRTTNEFQTLDKKF